MWRTLLLIPPVLFPSWRFFRSIEPSPRVQWAYVPQEDERDTQWREFRPRPLRVSPGRMICRLFWNAPWNEALFLVSCAERIQQGPADHSTDHSIAEIRERVARDIRNQRAPVPARRFRFRLVFLHRDAGELVEEEVFASTDYPVTSGVVR